MDKGDAVAAALSSASTQNGGAASIIGSLVGDNPYFQAGFGLLLTNRDHAYDWFLGWMARNTDSTTRRWLPNGLEKHKNGSSNVFFNLVAGPGTHYLKYQGAWMQVRRERETRAMQLVGAQSGGPWETIVLTTLSRDRFLFPKLLAEARDLAIKSQEGKLVIHTAWSTQWQPFGQPRGKRPLQSVVLAPGVAQKVENDVRTFLDRKQWYVDRGIPYRRGYLLHGPPGSGKSSFIQALAGALNYDICLLNLAERGLTDDRLMHLLTNAPERSFILIEDVDAAFNKRVQTSEDGCVPICGHLLRLPQRLDGVASGEERVVFMTTNHLERLDPALVRPGRVDLIELIDDATPEQARTLYTRFYGGDPEQGLSDVELDELATRLEGIVASEREGERRVSMASLQGLFIQCDARYAVQCCEQYSDKLFVGADADQ
ncbi:P-loop containing nucleoside triphosphate hydrolase protein [Schizophyllum amplum]|uniref:P-loop containing nucleoside triphosphate hydrolase protein n=1 Tax=Schizophyllum amplum TaxID=97359 RepID=A0A550CCZ7_9AGAR|nr:P-loop containing nucleoside triphosphate hydrolase protein [Auriculariopsis ampla]